MWMNIISVISTHLLKKLKAMHMTQLGGFRVMIICLFIYVKWHQPIPLGCHIFMTFLHQAKLSLLKKDFVASLYYHWLYYQSFSFFLTKKYDEIQNQCIFQAKIYEQNSNAPMRRENVLALNLKKKKNDSLLTMRSLQMKKSCFILNFHT